jgi:NADH-quinone oxidoreductase subunit J
MSFIGFVLSAVAVASALGVVMFRNPLTSAFSLIVNLLAMAGLYAAMGAHFLAVTQVVVYAGAIMVLVLFVLMLLNLKFESKRRFGIFRTAVAVAAGVLMFATIVPPIMAHFDTLSTFTLSENMTKSEGSVKAIGTELYGRYMVQFELSSLVLLIGVVGAVMLAKRKTSQIGPRDGAAGGAQ